MIKRILDANDSPHRQNRITGMRQEGASFGKNQINYSIGTNFFNIVIQLLGKLVVITSA